MTEFIRKHSEQIKIAAHNAIIECGILDDQRGRGITSFIGLMAFLADNNASISSVKEQFGSDIYFKKAAQRYFKGRSKHRLPIMPRTVPDPMVSVIMKYAFDHKKSNLGEIAKTHQQSMACENAVGNVLESYISSVLEPAGWCWCSGTLVKAVDFLRYDERERLWESLQVKNRDNSENSSSSAIRNGTPIKHWFRTFSATGETNWDAFPAAPNLRMKLSENGFKEFVENYYKTA